MPLQQNVISGPFGCKLFESSVCIRTTNPLTICEDQFTPESFATAPAPPPATSPTPSSTQKLLDREELTILDDFIDNPETSDIYNEADLDAMAEALPPAVFGWTSTMLNNETFAPYDVTDYVDPLYRRHWQSQSHYPSNNHHIYSAYQPPALASNLVSSDQAINPLVTVSTTLESSTDKGLNPGLKHHPSVPEENFSHTEHTRSDFPELEFPAPEPSSSVASIRAAPFSINGPVSTEGEAGTFPNRYPARFASLDMTDVYQYGNDTRFEPNGYVSPSDQEAADGSELNQMSFLKCLERTDSVENTRSSSPELKRQAQQSNSHVPDSQALKTPRKTFFLSEENQNQQTSSSSGSRKRQRDIIGSENEWQIEDSVKFGQNNKKIGSGNKGQISPASDTSPSKRPKYGRCNLSDDQKKANHTKAEQERRNAIKKNLSELIELVPGLKSEKLNKCQSITCISDWLEKLTEDNKKLTIKLKESLGEKAFKEAFMRASSSRGQ